MTRWGVVTTLKASQAEVLRFAAYHLELGAHRLYLYLDAPDDTLAMRLARHPKISVFQTDAAWWARRNGRPKKHQVRQCANAADACARRAEVDWLAHIDVDEFLWPVGTPIEAQLAALPRDCLSARMRPIEALAGEGPFYKAFHPRHAARRAAVRRLYPKFGQHLNGGFLSHVAGKLFFRTRVPGLRPKIHNVTVETEAGVLQNPGEQPLPSIKLCHRHAPDWQTWRNRFDARHARGSYRAELKPNAGGRTLHALFADIIAREGEDGLRSFFNEVCAARPDHLAALEHEGLLWRCDLDLERLGEKHLPKPRHAASPCLTPGTGKR